MKLCLLLTYIYVYYLLTRKKGTADCSSFQTVDKALLLQGFAIVGTAFLI